MRLFNIACDYILDYCIASRVSYSLVIVILYVFFFFCCLFFLQAEDGIRDLVRSRGLGDVYKRQHVVGPKCRDRRGTREGSAFQRHGAFRRSRWPRSVSFHGSGTVSYTHLTLPTSDLV